VFIGGQQERPVKLTTASRWHLTVEQIEEDEGIDLLFYFSYTESVW
jgi:hypothetical protein